MYFIDLSFDELIDYLFVYTVDFKNDIQIITKTPLILKKDKLEWKITQLTKEKFEIGRCLDKSNFYRSKKWREICAIKIISNYHVLDNGSLSFPH